MKIYIDADGCPVVNLAISIAKKYDMDIIIVKNYAHEIHSDYAAMVSVDISPDSVDFYILNHIQKGDIVITQDYGLAAMVLAKEAIPINQNGLIISHHNIDGMLNRRHLHRQLRYQNLYYGKTKKRSSQSNKKFEENFKKLINECL